MAEIIQEIRIHQFLLSSDFCSNMYIYFSLFVIFSFVFFGNFSCSLEIIFALITANEVLYTWVNIKSELIKLLKGLDTF